MSNKKNTNPSSQIRSILNEEDGQSEKLEEKRLVSKKSRRESLFIKDVNNPYERGYD